MERYTAVYGKHDKPIVTVDASTISAARKKILMYLAQNPSRASYIEPWVKSGKKVKKQ